MGWGGGHPGPCTDLAPKTGTGGPPVYRCSERKGERKGGGGGGGGREGEREGGREGGRETKEREIKSRLVLRIGHGCPQVHLIDYKRCTCRCPQVHLL